MKPVAIIANPASGKDIRRLVAHGTVFSNMEKVNIVRRILVGLEAMGVEQVFFMPEHYGICPKARECLDLSLKARFFEMTPNHTQDDSTQAARLAAELGVACLIVLGGDGTNRVVAKACGEVPLLSLATGTNNVFSTMMEGTLAGIAAGVLARGESPPAELTRQAPRLEIWSEETLLDIALVDVVISRQGFIASRALWNVDHIQEIFLTRAEPQNIGVSSVGGYLCHLPPDSGQGLHLRIGQGKIRVKAPLAPGLMTWFPIESYGTFNPGEELALKKEPAIIALDGEREMIMTPKDTRFVKLNLCGPRVVKLKETLQKASETGLLVLRNDDLS